MKQWICLLAVILSACSHAPKSTSRVPASEEVLRIPEELRIFSPSGEALKVQIRSMTVAEVQLLLQGNEADDPRHTLRYWKKNPKAYYRWDAKSAGEVGLITDIAKEMGMLVASGEEILPEALPRAVVAPLGGKERIVAIGASYHGDVKFHSDSELRRLGYKGLGTVILADYLRECYKGKSSAHLSAVNNSYGFYEKLGFTYDDPSKTPTTMPNPESERFAMSVSFTRIPEVLMRIREQHFNR